jgi:hypothetical protein
MVQLRHPIRAENRTHVEVVASEDEGTIVGQVDLSIGIAVRTVESGRTSARCTDLHADQTRGVTRKVVKGNTLAEIDALLVEGLPIEVEPDPSPRPYLNVRIVTVSGVSSCEAPHFM